MAIEDAGASPARHLHTCYEIARVESGAGTLLHRGGTREITSTHLVIISPGDAHAVTGTTGRHAERRLMWVSRDRLHRAVGQRQAARARGFAPAEFDAGVPPAGSGVLATATPLPSIVVVADPALAERFRALHEQLLAAPPTADRTASARALDAELVAFLDALVAAVYAGRPDAAHHTAKPAAQVARARAFLEDHWADPVSLDVLARVACYSRCHLNGAFRRAYGLPPRAYQTRLRLAHAQESLARGEPITGVAYETGFADQAHLTRAFKQAFGITPGGWARGRAAPARRAAAAA